MAVYDDQEKSEADYFGSEPEPELGSEEWREKAALAGGGGKDSPTSGPDTDYNGKRYDKSAAAKDEAVDHDQVGKGYSDDDEDEPSSFRQKLKGKSKTKKRMAIAGALAGGGGGLAVVLFFALLPLKIESIVTNLENRAGAASEQAMGKEADRLFKGYLVRYVLPGLSNRHCHSTVEPSCVANIRDKGPIGKLYSAWKNDKMEQKLAQRGLTFGRTGHGTFYINVSGKELDFKNESKLAAFLNDPDTTKGSKHEIEQALSKHLKEGTLWDRIYYRFRLAPFLNKKYGIRHCINACKPINKFTDSVSTKKKAAKAYIIQRVISPLSESYGLIMQCVLEGNGCGTSLEPASEGEDGSTRQTEISSKLQQQLDSFAEKFGKDSLESLVKVADDIGKDGLSKVIARELAKKIGSLMGKEVSGEAASKAVPVIGWVLMFAKVINALEQIGPMLRYLSYAANAAAAAQIFAAYQTVASETKSGQIDAVQLGSFNDALSSNLSGTKDDQSDATQTPLYQSMMDQPPSEGISFLGGNGLSSTAFADSGSNDTGYTCNDGKPVPKGKLVCEEEKLDRGNDIANKISSSLNSITSHIPGFHTVMKVINTIGSLIGSAFGKAFNTACSAFDAAIPFASPCHDALGAIGKQAAKLMTWLINKLVSSPITDNMSGGRIFDMMAAGADVSFNSSCQENLGCKQVSDKEAGAIQTEHLNQLQQDFQHRSMFARMFSTDTPYSFVSRLAVIMPSSLTSAGNQVASTIMQNPFSTFGQLFSGFFAPHRVMAGAPTGDPFGVPQNAYSDSDIPDDPQKFWDNNCVAGPYGIWNEDKPVGQQLDITPWLNNETHYKVGDKYVNFAPHGDNVKQNPNTGQAMFVHTNPCLLILSSIQSSGGLSDPSLLPQDSMSAGAQGGSQFRIATFNVEGMGHKIKKGQSWTAAADKSISTIESGQADVVGFQELENKQPDYFMQRLTEFDSYGGAPNAIAWRKDKFTLVKKGMQPDLKYFCNKNGNPTTLKAPYVELQDNTTGQEFYVLNTHDPANSSNNHCANLGPKFRYENALEHVKLMKKFESEGVPVFYSGDFNSRYNLKKGGGNGTPYQGKAANLTYCIITKAGFNDAYDAYSGRQVKCPNTTPPGTGPGIDHIYLSQSVQVTGFQSVSSPGNGSDVHPTLFFDVSIPGANTGAGSEFSLATWNLPVSHKAGYKSSQAQWANAVKSLKAYHNGAGIDVIGFQEFGANGNFKYLHDHLKNYASFPEKASPGNYCASTQPIFYNTDKFSFVKGDYLTYPRYNNNVQNCNEGHLDKGYSNAPIVWLTDKKTGQTIIVMNTHNAANGFGGLKAGEGPKNRYEADQLYVQKVQELKSENPGVPIFLTGDFNEGTDVRTKGNKTYQGKQQNLLFCMFAQNGLMKSTDGPAMKCDPKYGIGGVDYAYASTEVKVDSTYHIKKPDNGSDHAYALVANLIVPGTSTTGSGSSGGGGGPATPGKGFVGPDGLSYGWCTDYVKHVLARHSSKYHGGSLGDGKDVARNLGKLGYTVNHTPAVHAVVSFPGPPYGFVGDRYAGHVALVGQVNKDGSIVVEEFNFNNKMHYGKHTVSAKQAKTLTYAHTEKGWH